MSDDLFGEVSTFLEDLKLCELRLMHDGDNDWFLLVPKRDKIVEITELTEEDQAQLMKEICYASKLMKSSCECDKLNIGSLGNIQSQLHVHIIARKQTDRAWPGSIWGVAPRESFEASRVSFWKEKISEFKN